MLESKFKHNTKLIVRFIDDMLIVWEIAHNKARDWKEFKLYVSIASRLKWGLEDLREEIVFLDLDIWIDRQHSKFMNNPHMKKEYFF